MLAYGALAVALTWPLVMGLGTLVPGAPRTELWHSMWSLDFVAQSLAEGRLPLETSQLGFPAGGTIRVNDPLGALLVAPVTLLAGVNVAMTVLVWLQLAFAGAMAHMFAAEWLNWRAGRASSQRVGAAWVAGVSFCSTPLLLSALHNGELGTIGGGWGVWAAWMCWRAAAHGGRRHIELAVAALAVAVLGGWAGLATGLIFAAALTLLGAGEGLGVHIRARAVVLGVGLLVVVPLSYGLQEVARDSSSLQPPVSSEEAMQLRRGIGAADPVSYLLPGSDSRAATQRERASGLRKVHMNYVGWVVLGLTILGMRRSRKGSGFLVLGGSVGALLSLGPVLVRHGEPLIVGSQKVIPLPYFLVEALPGFDAMTMLYRLGQAPVLALALLAAAGVAGRRLRWLTTGLGLLVLEGRFVAPSANLPLTTRVAFSPAIQVLKSAPEGAVVNFPVVQGRAYLLEQVHHGKPMTGGLGDPASQAADELWQLVLEHQERDPSWVRAKISASAKRLGIRYVMIHVDPDAQPDMHHTAIQILERAYLPLSQPKSTDPLAPSARILKLW